MSATRPHVRGATEPDRPASTRVDGKAPTATTIVVIAIVLGLLVFVVIRGA